MNKKLLRSLAILGLAFSASQSRESMAQSIPDHSPGRPYIIDVRHSLDSTVRSAAGASLNTEDRAGALGPQKTKAYRFRSIDYPGSSNSATYDSNGKITVGDFVDSATTDGFAFYLKGTTYHTVNIPGAIGSFFLGINTPGQMVGSYYDSQAALHGFVYDGKSISIFDCPGSIHTEAADISDSGVIVGDYVDSSSHQHGFADKDGVFTSLDYPGAILTLATGINSSGQVVGFYFDSGGEAQGFLLSNGIYSTIDFPLAVRTVAFGINDEGDITGAFSGAD